MREVKDLTPSGSVTVPSLSTGIMRIEDRPQRLKDVVPIDRIGNTDSYAYLRETVRTNAAAEVAASALKPTSTYSVVKTEGSVSTIAHLSQPISRFDLEDAALLQAYIDQSLRAGVMLRLDSQIINGDGVAPNLQGINTASGISTILFATDLLTTTRKAVTELESDEIYGGVFVLHPSQWEQLELLTSPSPGGYVLGGPVDRAAQRLWGRSVIVTSACRTTSGYLVDFTSSTRLYERGDVRVDWSEAPVGSVAGEAAFKTNELMFRAEGRWGFALLRPAGVVKFPTA
jgi:HK97 family phage major capsid protein